MQLQHRNPFHKLPDSSLTSPDSRHLYRYPLIDLKSIYPFEGRWKQYFDQLTHDYMGFRPCHSRGNAVLKAFGIGFLEYLARHREAPKDCFGCFCTEVETSEHVFTPRPQYQESLQVLQRLLSELQEVNISHPEMLMYQLQLLFNSPWFDPVIQGFLKLLVLNYIDLHEDDEDSDFSVIQVSPEQLRRDLNDDSRELNDLILLLLSKALGVTTVLMNLEGRYGEDDSFMGNGTDTDIALYKHKGEYGVLYTGEQGQMDRYDYKTRTFNLGLSWSGSLTSQ